MAYDRVQRWTAKIALVAGGAVNPEAIEPMVKEMGDSLARSQTVEKKWTNIRKNADAIDDEVNGHSDEVRAELSDAEGTPRLTRGSSSYSRPDRSRVHRGQARLAGRRRPEARLTRL